MIRSVLITVVIPLLAGVIVAAGFFVYMSRLQFDEVRNSRMLNMRRAVLLPFNFGDQNSLTTLFSVDHAAETAQQLTARKLLRYSIALLLPQIVIVAGLLAYFVMRFGRKIKRSLLFGIICGSLVGIVHAGTSIVLNAPVVYSVIFLLLYAGVGALSGWYATPVENPIARVENSKTA
jgi:hypothetical protein